MVEIRRRGGGSLREVGDVPDKSKGGEGGGELVKGDEDNLVRVGDTITESEVA
jgi:hypothetical protein